MRNVAWWEACNGFMLYHYMPVLHWIQCRTGMHWIQCMPFCKKFVKSTGDQKQSLNGPNERFCSFKLPNSNAVAVRMAREYWKMHAQASALVCILSNAGLGFASSCIGNALLGPRPSRAFSNTPEPSDQQQHYCLILEGTNTFLSVQYLIFPESGFDHQSFSRIFSMVYSSITYKCMHWSQCMKCMHWLQCMKCM